MKDKVAPEQKRQSTRGGLPGKIVGSFELTLETYDGVSLTLGRAVENKPRICGLKDYASRTHLLYEAAKKDDPFAVYQLVQIESKQNEVEVFLEDQARELIERQKKNQSSLVFQNEGEGEESRLLINRPRSVKPVKMEFRFGNYATSAARLIKQFDEIALLARSMNHHNILPTTETSKIIRGAASKIRGLLTIGSNYRFTGVTRNDLKAKNKLARSAVQKLVGTKFIDQDMFKDETDICEYYAEYDVRPLFGPAQTGPDGERDA